MKFTKEQIRKAMNCKTVDELLAYAKSEGIEISRGQAEEYIAQLGKRKLIDDEIDQVVGGCSNRGVWQGCSSLDCPNDKLK